MSGGAVIGAAAIGAGTSYMASKSASKSADKALASSDANAQLQYQASAEQLAFQKEQLDRWESIFGPVQDNLSNYYKNLSSDSIASQGLQNIHSQYTQSRQNLDTALAKRGITNSGATAASLTQLESSRMLGAAEVRTNAPMVAAQQQLGFVNSGNSQQANANQGISSAYSNKMNMFGQQSLNNLNLANNYTNQAAQAYAGIGNSIGTGISTYMNYNSYQNNMNPNNGQQVQNNGAVQNNGQQLQNNGFVGQITGAW